MFPLWIIPATVLLFLSIVHLAFKWLNRRYSQISAELPGPKNYPLIGCAHLFVGKSSEEQFAIINRLSQQYSSPARAWLGPNLVVFIDNPEDLQVVLNSPNCLEKATQYRFFRCDKGLFSSPASVWKVHRKLLSPCFSPQILASFVPIFNRKSSVLIKRIEKNVGGAAFDIFMDIARCTLDMICATTLGTNMDLQNDEGTEYVRAIEEVCEIINQRAHKIWLYPDWIYNRTKICLRETKALETSQKMRRRVLELRRTNTRTRNVAYDNDIDGLKKPQLYIDQIFRLAEDNDTFDEQAITDELDTIIAGGMDTTALTLSHVILMLAIHEDVQQRVYQEVINALGSSDSSVPVDCDHIANLHYTEMAIKEAMRLFPVGCIIGRTCTTPTKISKTTIPEGTLVALGVYNVHRNPRYWGDHVNRFNPDRFLPEAVAERHPYAFLPFSGGPRNCIGYKYGLMAMKIMLCHLLRVYRFSSPLRMEDLHVKMSVSLKIANRHIVQIEKRK